MSITVNKAKFDNIAGEISLISEWATGQRWITAADVAAIQSHASVVVAWHTGEAAHG